MEYNFKLTKEEADRVVQALNNDAVNLISKLQNQFAEQENAINKKNMEDDQIILEENNDEENDNKNN